MKHILLLIIPLILFSSCYHENKEKVAKPKTLFSARQMVDILTDVQLSEGAIAGNRLNRKHTDSDYRDSIYGLVFHHYGITAQQLRENMDYYNSRPEEMEKIYNEVLSNLSRMKSEIEIKIKKDKAAKEPKDEQQ